MKVCTDACLFGAWVADSFIAEAGKPMRILDIGTGTGLLSMMLAQSFPAAMIDAVEIDPVAATQAAENVAKAPWPGRIHVLNTNILDHTNEHPYDLIISNPPFYENDLKSADALKNAAKHEDRLSLALLIKKIHDLLAPGGKAALLLPYHRMASGEFLLAKHGFYIHKKMLVAQTANRKLPFRAMSIFGKSNEPLEMAEMIIRKDQELYDDNFIRLLKPFYLNL
jgi:tRNA1Val (adenine37-N6)-methyltransferase